ncbi:MAG TPA: hypothetical protein VF668_15230 [Pyrinomonadaceae bacterium]|jgi:hypothetical protein
MTGEEEMSENLKARRLEVHLAEYAALREEINQRLERQRESFNYTVAVLGAFVAGAGLLAGKDSVDPSAVALVPHLMLLLPLIVGPLAFIFFDDELVLYRDIYHICLHLREKVHEQLKDPWEEAAGPDPLLTSPPLTSPPLTSPPAPRSDKPFLVEAEGFQRMWVFSNRIHPWLSYGRWLLFIGPVLMPLFVFALTKKEIRENPIKVGNFTVEAWPYSGVIFAIDIFILALLVLAILSVAKEQRVWRGYLGPKASAAAYAARPRVMRAGPGD